MKILRHVVPTFRFRAKRFGETRRSLGEGGQVGNGFASRMAREWFPSVDAEHVSAFRKLSTKPDHLHSAIVQSPPAETAVTDDQVPTTTGSVRINIDPSRPRTLSSAFVRHRADFFKLLFGWVMSSE